MTEPNQKLEVYGDFDAVLIGQLPWGTKQGKDGWRVYLEGKIEDTLFTTMVTILAKASKIGTIFEL